MEIQQCLSEIDAAKLRSLSGGALYQLHVLLRVFQLAIDDPALRRLADDLIPPDLRERLGS